VCAGDGVEVADGASVSLRAALLVILATISLPVAGVSPDEDKAIKRSEALQDEGKFDQAVATLAPYSDSRDPEVEYALAYAHMNNATIGRKEGEADEAEIGLAIDFANRAVAHGNAAGYNILYMIYGNGYGLPVDGAKAADYLKRGAAAGESGARLNYAISLYEGTEFIARDRELACPLMKELLKDEKVQALIAYQVGLALIRGHCGFKADPKAGVETIEIAAKRGVTGAERDMGMALEKGLAGEADPVKAIEWYEKAAAHGDGYSLWRLGMAHVEGTIRLKDPVKAVEYFQRAADAGSADGMGSLAVMYVTGDGVPLDYAKALTLYQRSAELGNAHAYREMAVMYMQGEGVSIDLPRAYSLYLKALEKGDPEDPRLRQVLEEQLKASGVLQAQ
jgi:TPR repeat protein